jgi:hypothetical protein
MQDVTDVLTRRIAEQILREMKELHKEHNPSEPLVPGISVAPDAAAERIGISPVGHWYATALKYLEEEGALQPNMRPGDVEGDPLFVLGARGPELMEGE